MNIIEEDTIEHVGNDETTEEGKTKEWGISYHQESGIGEGVHEGWTIYPTMGKITVEGMLENNDECEFDTSSATARIMQNKHARRYPVRVTFRRLVFEKRSHLRR